MGLSNAEIIDFLLHQQTDKQYKQVEKQLKIRLKNNKLSLVETEELTGLLVICQLQMGMIETDTIRKNFHTYRLLIQQAEAEIVTTYKQKKHQKTHTAKYALEAFYASTIQRLYYIENLYRNINTLS